MSTTLIEGGPAGPDEAGAEYQNQIETDRAVWWQAVGARQGVARGFGWSTVGGQMALSLAAGLALVEERDSVGATGVTSRGYGVWSDAAQNAQFDPASASDRKDAVVLAFCDLAAGAGAFGTGTSTVGGQIVVVPGSSGTTTPRTDSQIQDYVGSGGWLRYADVLIESTDTEINAANVTETYTSTGTVTPWSSRYASANVTLADTTWTTVTFDTIVEEEGFTVDGSNRFVAPYPMICLLQAKVFFDANSANRRAIRILHNGIVVDEDSEAATPVQGVGVSTTLVIRLAVGDTLEVQAWQNSGAALDVLGVKSLTNAQIVKAGT